VRERVTCDLGTTFLLEASAGTGKTSVLVDRYVCCVLDPERGSHDVRTVAAITFTEKAAGELRQRIREEFERRAYRAPAESAEALAIQEALDGLDEAPISTIHGFAARLLREFPVEAGVDPAFEQLDQLGGDLERAVCGTSGSRSWPPATGTRRLRRAPGCRGSCAPESVSTPCGARGGSRGVFGERYDLDPVLEPPGEPDLASGLVGLAGPLGELRDYCVAACGDHCDKGFGAAMELVEAGGRLLADPPPASTSWRRPSLRFRPRCRRRHPAVPEATGAPPWAARMSCNGATRLRCARSRS